MKKLILSTILLILVAGCVSASTVKYSRKCEETAIGAMLGARIELGFEKENIRLVRRENYTPKHYHVWAEVFINGQWVPIDADGRFYSDGYQGAEHYNHIKIYKYDAAFDRAKRLKLRKRRKGNLAEWHQSRFSH